MTSKPVLRFAPSPNGELHLGHAYSALFTADMARRLGGRFLLRIEDIDVGRCREEYVAQISEDLAWLGLSWEEPVLRQSREFDTYRNALAWLERLGVLYPCFATRSEIAEAAKGAPEAVDPDGAPLYPGLHKRLFASEVEARRGRGEPFALRLDMERALVAVRGMLGDESLSFVELDATGQPHRVAAHPERWGDAVIMRKDVPASYHLAVVIDDARQGVTHVTRGMDLYEATGLQRVLQMLLGLPEPVYRHHKLIMDEESRKLSKSDRDTSLKSLRLAGATAEDIRVQLGFAAPLTGE
jgi:glutamyl-Q tRNA(Asp) synthetase